MKPSTTHSFSSSTYSSHSLSTKPSYTLPNSQDFTSSKQNSETFYDLNSALAQTFTGKYNAPVPLGQHNFNVPTQNAPTEGFKRRTLITNDSRMDHPFQYKSPVENSIAQVESPKLTIKMEESVSSAALLSKNIVASTIKAVDNAQLIVDGKNVQVELELSGLKLYDLEQKLDSCLSSSRDLLNLSSKHSPRVSEILRQSDKKFQLSPFQPQKVTSFSTGETPARVSLKEITSSIPEQEKIQRLENERNHLKSIIKETTSRGSFGNRTSSQTAKSAGKENTTQRAKATITPKKENSLTIQTKQKSLGRSFERQLNESPLHPPQTTYNDSPLSKPPQTIPVESPYGLTKSSILKEYQGDNQNETQEETIFQSGKSKGLQEVETDFPGDQNAQDEKISPNFRTSPFSTIVEQAKKNNQSLNIYENRYNFSKKSLEDTEEINVYHPEPKSEKRILTRTSKGDWSFQESFDSAENTEGSTPTGTKVEPLPSLEILLNNQQSIGKKAHVLELEIPDSDTLRGVSQQKDAPRSVPSEDNQAIRQEIIGFLKNFERGEARESAKQWLKSLIDTENLSKASSPTNRTERERIEEAGETLMQVLMNQSQPKQSASETPTSSNYVPIDNSPKMNVKVVPKTRSDSNRISPRPGQARQIQAQKIPVPPLGTKIQNSGSSSSSSQKRTPRLSPRDNVLARGESKSQSFAQDLGHLESLRKTVERSINYIDKSLEDFGERRSAQQESKGSINTNSFIKKTIKNAVLKQQNEDHYLEDYQRRCQTEESTGLSSYAAKEKTTINTKYFVLSKNNKTPPAVANMTSTNKKPLPKKCY